MRDKGYYITYFSAGKIGNALIPCGRITDVEQLNLIKKHISVRYCNGEQVVILNYKRIKYRGVINNEQN